MRKVCVAITDTSENLMTIDAPIERIRLVFGPQDAHLRALLKSIPVNVVSVDDQIRITGENTADVNKALEVLQTLCDKVKDRQEITSKEVNRLLEPTVILDDPVEDDLQNPKSERPVPRKQVAGKVTAKTSGQARYMHAIAENDLVFCSGPAGSGKTYLAVAMALEALRLERVRKIVLVRPAVEAGERLGFLPGDMLAKVNPFLRPLLDALRDMLDFDTVQKYIEHDVIEIVPLAFMRGRTLNDTFMILDEAQNTTITQMKMFLTRMGTESKIVVTGDETQNDLPANVQSGLSDAMRRLGKISGIANVKLDGRDIVRHRLVREIVNAYDNLTNKK
ncbi:PhoH family protein [Rubinisphaera italica]|uniref:PhoH-like protein n=1 Tax=Rubinisphaera italica TaxID=2527969 RepID=A0A5C5XGM6_9PLAN|nr:PhoH family protein [Rubinisphaera italica]TWT61878.1 PhoH-like protein [Rubinisphaera italica]